MSDLNVQHVLGNPATTHSIQTLDGGQPHCFYDPGYYLSNPHKMLMVWEGGLASHGGAIGILTALFIYARRHPDQSYLWLLDRMVIIVALAGLLIRSNRRP